MNERLSIIATFFFLWLTSYIPEETQYYIAIGLILSLGILHGSNDLTLLIKLKSVSNKVRMIYFLSTYLLVVVLASVCFYFFPSVALISFVLFSGYHFGEQHYHKTLSSKSLINNTLYTAYGLFVLNLIFNLNSIETQEIIKIITGEEIATQLIRLMFVFTGLLLLACYIYTFLNKRISLLNLLFEIGLLLIFAIVFQVSNLIWSFTIYFIFWHSIPSMKEQVLFLFGNTNTVSYIKYVKDSFIIWSISILGMLSLLYIVRGNETYFIPLLFSFLGAITFAHAYIISKMFKS